MPDFTLFIPSEIITGILSYMNQMDSIECMIVCHRWYELIPEWGSDLFTEITIANKPRPKFNNAMLECLRKYVRKVNIISCEYSNKILQQLEPRECNIQSLHIKAPFRIYDFESDGSTLFSGVGLFGRTLKELYIDGPSPQHFSLPLLLSLLPALTHLTVKLKPDSRSSPSEYDQFIRSVNLDNIQSSDKNNGNYNLVFLCLDSTLRRNFRLMWIAMHCPRLKYLLVSEHNIFESLISVPISFARILESCPSVRYISWGYNTEARKTEKEWLALSRTRTRRDTNNENNNHYEKGEGNYLRQVEVYSEDRQQHILALKTSLQRPLLLEHLILSTSSHLDLYEIWDSFTQQNNYLLLQPLRLKSLELIGFSVPNQTENLIFFKDVFNYFQCTERLKLDCFLGAVRNLEGARCYIYKVVQAIGCHLHQLRYLYVGFAYGTTDGSKTATTIYDNLFTTLCDRNQKLDVLHLNNVPISSEMLLDLCHHPKLHTLNLSGCCLHKHLTKDALILFARKLQEQGQRSFGGIQSMLLSCNYCDNVTNEVLEELAGVKSLKALGIEYNSYITDAGINKFASANSSISKKHKRIELYRCRNVSFHNPHVVFVDSPF